MSAARPFPLESSGPWRDIPGEYGMSAIVDQFGHKVADVMCPSDGPVLAAAPDLLEALEEAENALSDYVPTIEKTGATLNYGRSVLAKARAAIAKAKGGAT